MALRFTLREAPRVPLEAEVLCPDRLSGLARREIETLAVWHGNERCRLGEFFTVAGQGTENVRVEGDLGRVKFIGSAMTGGRLSVSGSVGMHVGARMRGGEILVEGDADDWAGAEMRGGLIAIRGTAGHRLGGAYPGQRTGMRGGEIVVGGDAGSEAGAGLRRGLIAIGGRAGADTGLRMLAGTIVAFGGVGRRPGVGLRRGSIVSMGPADPLPTFAFACAYRPSFLGLLLRRLRALGQPVAPEQLDGRYLRWCGDRLELARGELLVWEGTA